MNQKKLWGVQETTEKSTKCIKTKNIALITAIITKTNKEPNTMRINKRKKEEISKN